ncbi:DinB family protein [Phycisphaerales bacterium AB-hyl4]|uniref:DinB family protein n=1 Tax=Natronomicrosphaera hydrolytica TaxID=3242702 RepID=A0ABV4U0C7_9BACT
MDTTIETLLLGWRENGQLARQLLADIPDEAMTDQPGGVVNHPAWTLAHLNHYHTAILSLVRGEPVADPGEQPNAEHYDAGSTPVDDPARYPSKAELLAAYEQVHQEVEQLLQDAPPKRLTQPPGLERWAEGFGTTAKALSYLMIFHESVHLGQVMAWKRAMDR